MICIVIIKVSFEIKGKRWILLIGEVVNKLVNIKIDCVFVLVMDFKCNGNICVCIDLK